METYHLQRPDIIRLEPVQQPLTASDAHIVVGYHVNPKNAAKQRLPIGKRYKRWISAYHLVPVLSQHLFDYNSVIDSQEQEKRLHVPRGQVEDLAEIKQNDRNIQQQVFASGHPSNDKAAGTLLV
jgi:hypothetical protein